MTTNDAPRADAGDCERCNRPNRVRFAEPTSQQRVCLDCLAAQATLITNETDVFLCPRRIEMPAAAYLGPSDHWRRYYGTDVKGLGCSHCGSIHPLAFMRAVTNGVELGPTDKSYKVYVDGPFGGADKFYFQHLSVLDRQTFIDLLNQRVPNIGYPGYFYTTPFFIARD